MAPWASLSLLCVTMLVLCACAKKHKQTCPKKSCYEGLFMPPEKLFGMSSRAEGQTVFFNQLFELTQYEVQTLYKENCGIYGVQAEGVTMLDCSTNTALSAGLPSVLTRRISRSTVCESCCRTEMSFSVPETVRDVYSGSEFPVKHFPTASQVVNLGHCYNPSASCGYGGTCEQAYRVEWMLVTVSGNDTFVPTSIPSHCTCIYT
ncbi:uncharacterized protein LOC143299001 [Babylonia areolata]|uniref:uncharacterized protein LOC143299001 n=1 Tax=Babylonia areolata TaxID=304850 RepID=UPI003FD15781